MGNFYGKHLRNFLSSINGEVIYSLPFRISGVVFQCCIRPNQLDETQIGFVGFKLLLKSVNHEQEKTHHHVHGDITIDFELNCTQTQSTKINIKHKDQFVYKKNSNLLKYGADKMVIGSYSFYDLMISSDQMRGEDKSLCFGCNITIKHTKKRKKASNSSPRAKRRRLNAMDTDP